MRFLFFLLFSVLFLSCKKDKEIVSEQPEGSSIVDTTGMVDIHISNSVNGAPMVLGATNYFNQNNDSFSVDLLKYFVTHIRLVSASGHTFTESNSYYLLDQSNPASLHLMIKNLPSEQFVSIQFMLGVDSSAIFFGVNTGALDPANGMFWSWNTGFVNAKMEGHSPKSIEPTKKIVYHIGGYASKFNSIREVTLNFPVTANVTHTHTPVLNLDADLYKWFVAPNFTDFSTQYEVTAINAESSAIADNYSQMFSVISVTN